MALTRADGTAPSIGDGLALTHPTGVISDTSLPTGAFQNQLQLHMQDRFGPPLADAGSGRAEPTLVAANSSDSGSAVIGSAFNYVGYLTYAGLIAGAVGKDDPLQLQTKAMRFFQEKILHHHASDNPQVWAAMGDSLMTEQYLASLGAKFKPVKLKPLYGEVKHESDEQKRQDKDFEHDAKDASGILKDITSGLKGTDDYVFAANLLYAEAVAKADERAGKEAVDHKDEKRLLGRLNLLSGETDRTDALGTRDNSIDPLLDELGSPVSYRLEEAALMDRYANKVPALNWPKAAAELRDQAKAIYDDPKAISDPVRRRLHQKYSDILTDKPLAKPAVPQPLPVPAPTAAG